MTFFKHNPTGNVRLPHSPWALQPQHEVDPRRSITVTEILIKTAWHAKIWKTAMNSGRWLSALRRANGVSRNEGPGNRTWSNVLRTSHVIQIFEGWSVTWQPLGALLAARLVPPWKRLLEHISLTKPSGTYSLRFLESFHMLTSLLWRSLSCCCCLCFFPVPAQPVHLLPRAGV